MDARELQKYMTGGRAVQIADGIEAAIREGALAPNTKLPTVRALAEGLGASPTTVATAYRTLQQRGVILSDGRRGTRVSFSPPLATPLRPALPADTLDLSDGNPDPELLPRFGAVLARIARRDDPPTLYGAEGHLPELLESATRDFAADGLRADALCVTSGALDAIERVLRAHLRPGDRIAVEDPGFTGVLFLARSLGLSLVPVAVDDEGPTPEALEEALRARPSAFVVTPRAQNPFGAALTSRRVRALRRTLAPHDDLLLIEDDHAANVSGAPSRSLVQKATQHFAIVRSYSKMLGPDLRTALLAGDEDTVARVEGQKQLTLRWVSHVLQRLTAGLLRDATVAKRVARAERVYGERRTALLEALAEHGLAGHGASGLNVWIPVPEESPVVRGLLERGFAVAPGERFRLRAQPAVRATTAALRPERARDLAAALARLGRPTSTTLLA